MDYDGKEPRSYRYKLNSNGNEYTHFKYEFNLIRAVGDTKTGPPSEPDPTVSQDAVLPACTFAPPPGTFNKDSKPSEALFKREIYDRYLWTVNGTTTAPKQVGLAFLSFKTGASYKNTVSVVAGRGAQRIHDGAPVNAIIYPVETKYLVCEEYSTGLSRKLVISKYQFFIGKDGEWTLSGDPYATTTPVD